ncbi:hypothetical protein MKJ04_15055 [Pontibacter sp. E15-1]|uniref:hypothetical protein n=1 Tax=Pontibacter sp. E15-1 TaxID=2919918 RepID=UPI001F4F29EF|nr:hypothetical protein [Pontibacter sp. E15-1]MCJ8166164.1 hypothetical protein [Pontibacter sp. E15-1]
MRNPSASDQADLALLAALFLMIVLFTSYRANNNRPEAEQQRLPATAVSAAGLAIVATPPTGIVGF